MIWVFLAHKEIRENILQLMHFGVYILKILNTKWLLQYRNNDSIAARMLGSSRTYSPKNRFLNGAIDKTFLS